MKLVGSLAVEPEMEMKEGRTIIKAPWAEKSFNEYYEYYFIEDGSSVLRTADPEEMMRHAFAAGWYSSNEAATRHGRPRGGDQV